MGRTERRWAKIGVAAIAVVMLGVTLMVVLRTAKKTNLTTEGEVALANSQMELIAALKNPLTRDDTVRSLKAKGDSSTVALVAGLALKSKDAEVRAACMTALGEIADPQGAHALTLGARDVESVVRLAAVGALGRIPTKMSYGALGDALVDGDVAVREAAARVLVSIAGDPLVIPNLIAAFGKESSVAVRQVLVGALGKYKADKGEMEDRARQTLISTLSTEAEASVRLATVDALLSTDDTYRVKGIVCAIGDSDAAVRARARGAKSFLNKEAIPLLEDAVKSGEFAKVAKGAQGKEVLLDVVALLDGLAVPETWGSLLHVIELAMTKDRKTGSVVISEPGQKAKVALARLGEPAMDPLGGRLLRPDVSLAMKQVAADIFVSVGAPSVKRIEDYVKSWKVLSSSEEARLWTAALEKIGGSEAATAAKLVRERDPAKAFAKQADEAVAAPTVPPVPDAGRKPVAAVGSGTGFSGEMDLVLRRAVYSGNPPSSYAKRAEGLPWETKKEEKKEEEVFEPSGRADLRLHITAENGVWERVFGFGVNRAVHCGHVAAASVDGNSMRLTLKIGIGSDLWLDGGYGEYEVALQRNAGGVLAGTFQGKSRETAINGKADGKMAPKRPALPEGFRPVTAGEHPRMLFRAHDLPRLRARLNTPMGQAAFARIAASGDAIGLGMAYQLTGDAGYAKRALPSVKVEMANRDFGFMGLGQVWGPRFSMIALTYDLGYAAWTPEFRAEVQRYLVSASHSTAINMGKFSTCANWYPGSNFSAPIHGGGAMLSLAYWGDKGSPPSQPPGGTVLNLTPVAEAPAGVVVESLVPRQSPKNWLWSGPIPGEVDVGALMGALPTDSTALKEGAVFKFNGEDWKFHPVPEGYRTSEGVYPWTGMRELFPNQKALGFVLHGVVRNERPGFYKVALSSEGKSVLRVSGVSAFNRSIVRLEQGLYPITLGFARTDDIMGAIGVSFTFVGEDEKAAQELIERNRERWGKDMALYETDKADYDRTGMDGEKIRAFAMCKAHMYSFYRLGMADGGFQCEGEGYSHTFDTPVRYAAAYWNMFGGTVSPWPDMTHFPFRYMATSVLLEGDREKKPSLLMQAFNGYDGIMFGVGFMVTGFPLIPDEYKPGVLWIWNKLCDVDPDRPETTANIIAHEKGMDGVIYAFLHYPLDMKPVHPSKCFPLTYQARGRGLYMYRNQWQGKDDIVFQVYANELRSGGHAQQNAAALRLYGLGKVWARTNVERDGQRCLDSVVLLPDDNTRKGDAGYVTTWSGAEDGSGHVSIDLNDVYLGLSKGRGMQNEWGDRRVGVSTNDLGIRGLRAVAVDYSGKCGAPGLFVLVDKITGGKTRNWLWHLPDGVAATVLPDGHSFLVTQNDTTMKATFVAPSEIKIQAPGTIVVKLEEKETRDKEGKKITVTPTETRPVSICAVGGPGTSFFVVLTLQKGAPPDVVTEKDSGLESVVRVGKRFVRFDGGKVSIADR